MTATQIAERYGLRAVARLVLVLCAFLLLYPLRKLLLLAARVLEVALQRLDRLAIPADLNPPHAYPDPPAREAAA